MIMLRQSTSVTEKLGPFVDEDDGKTAETGLTIAQADVQLSKNGAAFAQSNDSGGGTHDADGWYGVTLDDTDTATLGRLKVQIHVSGALPVFQDYMVMPANAWDSLFGTDRLQVHVAEITAAVLDTSAILLKILGAVAGAAYRNAAGTQIKFYTYAGDLLSTLDWNSGTNKWDVTWA